MKALFWLLTICVGLSGCAVLGGGEPVLEQDLAALHERQDQMQADFDQRMASMEMSLLRQEKFLRDYFDVPGTVLVDPEPIGPEPGLEEERSSAHPKPSENPAISSGAPDAAVPSADPATAVLPAGAEASLPAAAPKPAADSGEAFYERALQEYYKGEYARAREDFSAFASRFPESPLRPNALYWLAETHYAQKQYAQAVLIFKELTRRFPKSRKTPDALLKAGYAYEQLGDVPNARFHLRIVLDDHPGSHAATLAREKLETLPGE